MVNTRARFGGCSSLAACGAALLLGALAATPASAQESAAAAVTFAKESLPSSRRTVRSAIDPARSVPCRSGPTKRCVPGLGPSSNGGRAGDAALPLRQDRHPAPERRPAPERSGHPDDRALGGRRVAARQCRRPAGARAVPGRSKWTYEDVFGPPDLVVPTKPYALPAQGQDRWWRPIVPVGTTVDRCIKALSVKPS